MVGNKSVCACEEMTDVSPLIIPNQKQKMAGEQLLGRMDVDLHTNLDREG